MISHDGQGTIYVNPSHFDNNPSLDKTTEILICLVVLCGGYYLLASILPPVWRMTTRITSNIWWITTRPFVWTYKIVLFPFKFVYGKLFPRSNQQSIQHRRSSWARRVEQQYFNQFIRYPAQNNKFARNRTKPNKLRKKNFELSKKVSELTKENARIKNTFLRSTRNKDGQLVCIICGLVFISPILDHTRRSVILPCNHAICYNCAQTRAAERRRHAFNQAPACPRCNVQYNQNQLQYIQL